MAGGREQAAECKIDVGGFHLGGTGGVGLAGQKHGPVLGIGGAATVGAFDQGSYLRRSRAFYFRDGTEVHRPVPLPVSDTVFLPDNTIIC